MALSTKRQSSEVPFAAPKAHRRAKSRRQPTRRGLGDLLASMFSANTNRTQPSARIAAVTAAAPFMPATLADITALRNAASIASR